MLRFITSVIAFLYIVVNVLGQTVPVPMPVSGTLPVVYVVTKDSVAITSKVDYIDAKIWIDPMGLDGYEAFGSEDSPVKTEIRGRGNSTWNASKKPYKVKLKSKASPLGMARNKHFALIAHAPTQSYIYNESSFELARLIGLGWVPNSVPVEFVLNGVNQGVYAFSETVRIDDGRLEIDEQPDNNEDLTTIGAGWLVEIDNTVDSPQIIVNQNRDDTPGEHWSRFTIKTPEELSEVQEEWITNELKGIMRDVFNPDTLSEVAAADWMSRFDIVMLARYYIIQELTCNFDAFIGSTYFYRADEDSPWTMGPMWDSQWTWEVPYRTTNFWMERYQVTGGVNGKMIKPTWIMEMLKFKPFLDVVYEEWKKFYPSVSEQFLDFIDDFYERTHVAYGTNELIWQLKSASLAAWCNNVRRRFVSYAEWFDGYISSATSGLEHHEVDKVNRFPADVYNSMGICVKHNAMPDDMDNLPSGIYIVGGKKIIIK